MNHINSPVFGEYYDGMKSCVLDIEATGLDPGRSKVVLMGLLMETEQGLKVTQFLAENHYEEDKVLEATFEFLKEKEIDYLITYNGLRYDIPFINTRSDKLFIGEHIDLYDFDLYRFLRKCSTLPKQLESLSQSSVETYFGIAKDRQDVITGKENIALFDEYALTGNSTAEKIILTHNREDVLQLYKLLKLCSNNDFRDILDTDFHSAVAKYGFPVLNGRLSARPALPGNKKMLRITGDQNRNPVAAAYFPDIDHPATAIFNATSSSFEISLPIDSQNEDYYFDLRKMGLSITDDPDVINDYLILNSRTINLLTRLIVKKYFQD